MEPVIAACLLEGQTLLCNAARTLRERCDDGITANEDVCRLLLERSMGTVTALNLSSGTRRRPNWRPKRSAQARGLSSWCARRKVDREAARATLDPAAMTGTQRRS